MSGWCSRRAAAERTAIDDDNAITITSWSNTMVQ